MEAALITRMFNVGYSVTREPAKDVFTKKDSDFKDVLTKSMESENNKDVKKKDESKKDVENEDVNKTEVENENDENIKDVDDKEVNKKDKDKKEDKKVTEVDENKTEKINGLIEKKLEVVENLEDLENIVNKIEEIQLNDEGLDNIQEELKSGLMQNVVEVGPQSVETEKITLDKFEKLEDKLDSLAEKLGLSNEENSDKKIEDGAETNNDSESDEELESDLMSSMEKDVLNLKEVKRSDVKNRDDKFKITDLRKNNTFENNGEQLETDVLSVDNEIPKFEIQNTSNIFMNRAEKLQEQIDVLKQITEKVTVNILEDKSEMLIKLKPDNLGKVTMQIAVENGNVTAKFLAESERVKEILESNMQELKDHLAKQGMAVQDLSVSVGNENREREMFEQRHFKVSRRGRSIEKIDNNSYISGNEIYEDNDVNLATYWPDSTVSFSA